ncbi:MAG: hypothetical protein LUC99_10960 [Clostridiales bacterium]|nr:hypothetical protein [Clostridiales bacterium]
MKKTIINALVLAAVLAATPICVFAEGSIDDDYRSSASDTSTGSPTITVGAGQTVATATTPTTATTSTTETTSTTVTTSEEPAVVEHTDGTRTDITQVTVTTTTDTSGTTSTTSTTVTGLAYNTSTTTGEAITRNEQGDAVIGDTAVSIQSGEQATAGLSESTINTMNNLSQGNPETVAALGLDGYSMVGTSVSLQTKDAATGLEKTGNVEVTLYVSDLPQAGGSITVVYIDNLTGLPMIIQPTRIDAANGFVSLVIPGSGTAYVMTK